MTIGDFVEYQSSVTSITSGSPQSISVPANSLLIVNGFLFCNNSAVVFPVRGQIGLTGDAQTDAKTIFASDIMPHDTMQMKTHIVIDGTTSEVLKFFTSVASTFMNVYVSGILRQVT